MANIKYLTEKGAVVTINTNKQIASGGEGAIYIHPNNKDKVIKIYHKSRTTDFGKSLKSLSVLDGKFFVKPEEILYDNNNQVAGFIMRYIDLNKFFVLKKLTAKSFCQQNNFDRKFKFKVQENLKKAVENAHSHNIVIGDLNPFNIFFNTLGEVVLVDVDSYATPTKPHNGVLLEDIRDFMLFPKINHQTDAFAFDVLTYWMFCYVHPYRGNCPRYKTLEERIVDKASILSGMPDIGIPNVHEPFNNPDILNQFIEVFQNGKRFLVNLNASVAVPVNIPPYQPLNLSSNELYIRLIEDNVIYVNASENLLIVKKQNDEFKTYNLTNYGTYNIIKNFVGCKDVFVGNKNIVELRDKKLFYNNIEIKNIVLPDYINYLVHNETIFILDVDGERYYQLSIDNILNNQIQAEIKPIFSPSIQITDTIIQNIGGSSWLFIPNKNNYIMVKTNLNVKNAYVRKNIACIEHIENNKVKYDLFKLEGSKLDFITNLTDFSYFDVKGDFIFVPKDNKIDLISILRKQVIVQMDCPVCKCDSKLFQTNSGMILYTDNKVYHINKKQ